MIYVGTTPHPTYRDHRVLAGPLDLVGAMLEFRTGLCIVPRSAAPFAVPAADRPVVTILGDDLARAECTAELLQMLGQPAGPAAGPSGFDAASLSATLQACGFVIVVATEPHQMPYTVAHSYARELRQNAAIIETGPDQVQAWLAVVQSAAPAASIAQDVCAVDAMTDLYGPEGLARGVLGRRSVRVAVV